MTKVKELAQVDSGFGTVGGEKSDLVWEEACDNLNEDLQSFVSRVPVSESHIRRVLKRLPPESFGL